MFKHATKDDVTWFRDFTQKKTLLGGKVVFRLIINQDILAYFNFGCFIRILKSFLEVMYSLLAFLRFSKL